MTSPRHFARALFGLVAAGTLLAACTTTQNGQPTPTPSDDATGTPASGSADSTNASSRAPKVGQPLDDTRLVNDPCSVLNQAQLQTLGFTSEVHSTVSRSSVANICNWNDDTTGADVSVGAEQMLTNGLNDIYTQRNRLAYFVPTTVDGYPAVLGDQEDARDNGDCFLDLGLSDTSVANIGYQQDGIGRTSCDKVQEIAHLVISAVGIG